MHYVALVLVAPDGEPEDEVARLLAPYDENDGDNEDGKWDWNGKWDWWVIGGRWTGVLNREYDPEKDPANYEVCRLCAGTGTRTDMTVANGCNGCKGTGTAQKWPTEWVKFAGDVKPVADIDVEWTPFTLVEPDGSWHERESFVWDEEAQTGEIVKNFTDAEWRRFIPKMLKKHRDKIAVVVDYHN